MLFFCAFNFIKKTVLIAITIKAIFCEDSELTQDDDASPEVWNFQDYENWEQEPMLEDEENNDNSWETSQEAKDIILYDLYVKRPELITEEDEDGIELSDSWIILDPEDADYLNSQQGFTSSEEIFKANGLSEETTKLRDTAECDETVRTKPERKGKIPARTKHKDEFYFKHKAYSKKRPKQKKKVSTKRKWKQNCCVRGKKVGNGKRTFLSENIFQECQNRTRSLASRMSKSCKWIFWSCCEARALRRYYVHHKSSEGC